MITHDQIFKKVIYLATVVILYILLLAIIAGMFDVFQNIADVLLRKGDSSQVVYSVLTIFVLIDLFKTFADYRVHERIRLTYVTDATILIVMREVTVLVYSHHFETDILLVFSVLLLVLGIIRFISIRYHPSESSDPFSLEE
ncbi:phosphate-starvation-inducible PsiE family protein [Methanolobus sp. ZRKC3]|uniref:phosphate-starvation-inducible PsiE family protein n=1 Tax=Methanolobus sp. ZRKC3 TaxID=3125786 RepID=UPI003253609D